MNTQSMNRPGLSPHPATIRVARVARYGAPATLGDTPRPELRAGAVRIAVEATTVTAADSRIRAARVPRGMRLLLRLALGWRGPRQSILGTEFTGTVIDVGEGVTSFRAGDPVIAVTGVALGAHAEVVVLPADGLIVPRPAGLGIAEAAAIAFGGLTASHYLRVASVKAGERVLVVGASGAVGLAAIQLARLAGAEVTAVCSGANADLVRSLGAVRSIDYLKRDVFSDEAESARWDVIIDAVGTAPYSVCRSRLAPGGRLARVVCDLPGQLAAPFQGRLRGHRVIAGVSQERREALLQLCTLAARGEYRVVIDSAYPFEAIAAAHARVDSGHKRGNVVVTMV